MSETILISTHVPTPPLPNAAQEGATVDLTDLVIQHHLPSVGSSSPEANLQGKVQLAPRGEEESSQLQVVDTVGTFVLGGPSTQARGKTPAESSGYVLIPEDREFQKEKCLAGKCAQLWLSTQLSSGGIERSVTLHKKREVEDKNKKLEADGERQAQLDDTFARFKFALGLSSADIVNYSIDMHTIHVYDRQGKLQGKYDLLETGANEDPKSPVTGGGGLKQLLRSQGYIYSDEQLQTLAQELQTLNKKMRKIIAVETGGRLSYIFEGGNKGNLRGVFPLTARGKEGSAILHSDEKKGLYLKTMNRLGFVKIQDKQIAFTERGVAAFNDIFRAAILQRTIMQNIEKTVAKLSNALRDLEKKFAPEESLIPNEEEKKEIEALRKEVAEMESLQREIGQVNTAALHLILMQLNSDTAVSHPSIRPSDGRRIHGETKGPAKKFLQEISPQDYAHFGVKEGDSRGAATARSSLIEQLARSMRSNFEATVVEESSARTFLYWLGFRKKPLDRLYFDTNPGHREVRTLGTQLGALFYDIAAIPSSDPARLRKIAFLEEQGEGEIMQESRALEFLASALLFEKRFDLRGYSQKSAAGQEVVQKSLRSFREHMPDFSETILGNSVEDVVQETLAIERESREG